MNNRSLHYLFRPPEHLLAFQLLEEIEQNSKTSQRELSNKFGIALGVTNACIKRMTRRGLIKLKGIPPRRIAYYLTPKGLAEKSKLMLNMLSYNVQHYSEMKKVISKRLFEIQCHGVKRIVFYGVSDEMEIAYITLQGLKMELVGILDHDEKQQGKMLFGYRVQKPEMIPSLRPDAVFITSLINGEKYFDKLKEKMDIDKIHLVRL